MAAAVLGRGGWPVRLRPRRPVRACGCRAFGSAGGPEKEPSAAQMKRAQSLRLMIFGLVSLAGGLIVMRAQRNAEGRRTLEEAQAQARAQLAAREAGPGSGQAGSN